MRKVVRDREIKTICKITVTRPLAIGAKIGDRTLDLHDQQVAGLAESKDVGAAPVDQRKFDEAGVAELVERAADTAREKESSGRRVDGGRSGYH